MMDSEIKISDFKGVSMNTIDVENEHHKWQSCLGGATDSRLLKFCAMYTLIFQVFSFCLYMLSKSKTCEDTTTYISLLTFLLGLVIPTSK